MASGALTTVAELTSSDSAAVVSMPFSVKLVAVTAPAATTHFWGAPPAPSSTLRSAPSTVSKYTASPGRKLCGADVTTAGVGQRPGSAGGAQ